MTTHLKMMATATEVLISPVATDEMQQDAISSLAGIARLADRWEGQARSTLKTANELMAMNRDGTRLVFHLGIAGV